MYAVAYHSEPLNRTRQFTNYHGPFATRKQAEEWTVSNPVRSRRAALVGG